ncbi:DUF1542 domain-containing protein, partial [Lactobacillus apis]|uniref:DUF1542 domain-containing protein n=2 Tax=Lactobacillus apis TaxID=303541 RepID=UPI0016507339
ALAAAEAAIENDPALTAAEKADQKAKAEADAAAADKAIDAAKTADDIEAACKAGEDKLKTYPTAPTQSLDDRRTAAHNRIKDALAAAEAAIENDPALTAAEKADQKAKA